MASEGALAKRSTLAASRVHWSNMDLPEFTPDRTRTITPLKRSPSSDDDLALGLEASLYGSRGSRTVQEFLWWSRSSPSLSRWNSINSTISAHSGPLSVMDILNLWK
ncbi:hypothetical protein F7725_029044 [Dissostichus mawsoni]|uniref:Uncharacterized protein n=1 Tax=Dissostichus mawsoni TaxID=36200 RepID=A0A7J5XHB5_DISMA|nr:hypothetical protein F7725_029044 [Dissostichus mawsoni]